MNLCWRLHPSVPSGAVDAMAHGRLLGKQGVGKCVMVFDRVCLFLVVSIYCYLFIFLLVTCENQIKPVKTN